MTTLARVTSITRLILKWGIILTISLIALTTLGREVRNRFFPTPPPAPTVAFGKLPILHFPKSVTSQKLSYSLETFSGSLPNLPSQVKVYQVISDQPGLLSLQKAKERVAKIGFINGEVALSTNTYRWLDTQNGRSLKFNIVTNDFDLSSNFFENPLVLSAENLPSSQKAEGLAKNFFSQLDLLPSDLGEIKTSLWTIQKNNLLSASSFSNAQIVKVNFFQKSLDNLSIISSKKDTSLINVFIASNKNEGQIVEAHFFYRSPDLNNSSTYPLKTPAEAFEELKNNEAYIANINDKTKTDISIKNVYLAYYIDPENQGFFEPVFVFEGDNSFSAYLPAISSSWFEEKPTQ